LDDKFRLGPRRGLNGRLSFFPVVFLVSLFGFDDAQGGQLEPVQVKSVEVLGTAFVVKTVDGRVLRSPQLVGAALTVSTRTGLLKIRIDAVNTDPGDERLSALASDAVWLHQLSYQADDGEWRNFCEAGPDGRTQGFPLAGEVLPDGAMVASPSGLFEIVCTGGARGKCVRFGYHPWEKRLDGVSTWNLFNACVRLVRADYAGDCRGTTRDGQEIDIYDRFGIQTKASIPTHDFEAGFNAAGAVCVRHVRVKENANLSALETEVFGLRGKTGAICTEEYARAEGALLFVRSPP
jgi:ADYC domain